jgi:hypothetical protein
MATQEITVEVKLEGQLTHCGQFMTKITEVTTWEQGFKVTALDFVCTAGCGATATYTAREPA